MYYYKFPIFSKEHKFLTNKLNELNNRQKICDINYMSDDNGDLYVNNICLTDDIEEINIIDINIRKITCDNNFVIVESHQFFPYNWLNT